MYENTEQEGQLLRGKCGQLAEKVADSQASGTKHDKQRAGGHRAHHSGCLIVHVVDLVE